MGQQPPTESAGDAGKLSLAPCNAEYTASLKCLDRNRYDKEACAAYFDAYKECRKQEVASRLERRIAEQNKR